MALPSTGVDRILYFQRIKIQCNSSSAGQGCEGALCASDV